MAMMIGFVTIRTLVWALASSVAREGDAEKQGVTTRFEQDVPPTGTVVWGKTRRAAKRHFRERSFAWGLR
jgi:hypothetical protein